MGERLTDTDIDSLLTLCSVTRDVFSTFSTNMIESAMRELQARRALDLTSDEVEALRDVATLWRIRDEPGRRNLTERERRALAVLDKLLSHPEAGRKVREDG